MGVNIAARLEGLAEAGGICISGTVHDQIENKLVLGYEYLGEQTVKNITKPVRVWRVGITPPASVPVFPSPASVGEGRGEGLSQAPPASDIQTRRLGTIPRSRIAQIGAGLLILIGLVTLLYFPFQTIRIPQSPIRNQEALPLPDKPSIAVLPFLNISGDPEQEYFSDGITEDIITDLSKISGLFVIDRNSMFTYKGRAVKVAEVGRELGVRHVLEGSVRKAGNRVRINVQLIDAPTYGHMWAERYDRELNDIFSLQDEITREIVTALNVKLTHQELERVAIRHTNSVEAFDYFLRGLAYYLRYTPEANTQARQLWENATELDPTYADAYAYIGYSHWIEMIFQWSAQPTAALEHAFTRAQQALALDATLPVPHMLLGSVCLYRQQYDEAIQAGEQAIALGPNFAPAYLVLGEILGLAGRGQEAIEVTEKAMRLNPHYPAVYLHDLGLAYLFARQ